MMARMARIPAAGFALTLVLSLAACGPTTTSPSPQAQASAGPTEAPPRAELVLGCLSVGMAECRFIAERFLAVIPADRGGAFSVQVQLFQCENPGPCPPTLDARIGRAIAEYAGGAEPVQASLEGPALTPRITLVPEILWSEAFPPSSQRVGGPGPFEFSLGHCGLTHVIDFDGSFWLPLGEVNGDDPASINAEPGEIRLLGANIAQFTGESGFTAQLARFPGPKRFFLCD
jgi:hypothetical protein